MKYQEFVNEMQKEVQKRLENEVKVEVYRALKNNGVSLVGLNFCENNIKYNASPIIYLEQFFLEFQNDDCSVEELASKIIKMYREIKRLEFNADNLMDINYVKNNITMRMINIEMNKELLMDVPYYEYLDLVVCLCIKVELEEGTGVILVRNKHLLLWNITKEELFQYAKANTERFYPAKILSLDNMIYVLSNKNMEFGASVILYADTLDEIKKQIGCERFYLFPSSIHEWIIYLPNREVDAESVEYFRNMVSEINKSALSEEEVLSNNVYFCDGEKIMLL